MNIISFEDLKKQYRYQRPICESIGKIYNKNYGTLRDIRCDHWKCAACRRYKKYELYEDILRYVYMFDLQRHFVITSEGEEYRRNNSYEDSYVFMAKQWNKLKMVIEYEYGKLRYICLPRSQVSGYCHYHILINKYVDWDFLNEKRKKYGLGYVSIQRNKDVAEYLNKDYFKDHEWIIPEGIRHYHSSRDIKLMNYYNKGFHKIIFNYKISNDHIKKLLEMDGMYVDLEEYYVNRYENDEYRKCLGISKDI